MRKFSERPSGSNLVYQETFLRSFFSLMFKLVLSVILSVLLPVAGLLVTIAVIILGPFIVLGIAFSNGIKDGLLMVLLYLLAIPGIPIAACLIPFLLIYMLFTGEMDRQISKMLYSSGNDNFQSFEFWENATPEVIYHSCIEKEDLEKRDSSGETLLNKAIHWNKNVSTIESLVRLNVDLETRGAYGTTPLGVAAHCSTPEIIEMLLKYGAQLEAKNDQGFTPLILAAGGNCLKAVEVFINYGANVNSKTKKGVTALMHASGFNEDICCIIELPGIAKSVSSKLQRKFPGFAS